MCSDSTSRSRRSAHNCRCTASYARTSQGQSNVFSYCHSYLDLIISVICPTLEPKYTLTYLNVQLVAINTPDKIIFVGEALVGNEAVDQLTKFDRALRDFSSASGAGKERGIDGMLVTKWDTVDDKVCTDFVACC